MITYDKYVCMTVYGFMYPHNCDMNASVTRYQILETLMHRRFKLLLLLLLLLLKLFNYEIIILYTWLVIIIIIIIIMINTHSLLLPNYRNW